MNTFFLRNPRFGSSVRTITATLLACALLGLSANAESYYLCSKTGSDRNDGLSAEKPWKSLKKANSIVFQAGDSLLLASDSVFSGQLTPKGSGVIRDGKMVPIRIDRFGEGALPRIDGRGKVNAPLFLENVEGWEISNLELTNKGPEKERMRYGLYVENNALPTARHFVVRNVKTRDVNGTVAKEKYAGAGICFFAIHKKGHMGPGRNFNSILIENCHIKDCSRDGIRVYGGALRDNWNPARNVIIRHNLIEGVGGDGIVPSSCESPLVEWNIMRDCPAYGEEGGAAAGMWPWSCDNALFQFNEVVGHRAWNDAQAYDCDYNCNNTVYQYNLSRDNEGGFMLICSPGIKRKGWLVDNAWNKGSVVRYNLSINDGLRTIGHNEYSSPIFKITGETTQETDIYSNLIIVPKKPDPKMDTHLIHFDIWGSNYPIDTTIQNNAFVLLDGQQGTFDWGKAKQVRLENNRFYGSVDTITETHQVSSEGDQFIPEIPQEVVISGPWDELNTFADFLAKKGNPHEALGITIRGQIEE